MRQHGLPMASLPKIFLWIFHSRSIYGWNGNGIPAFQVLRIRRFAFRKNLERNSLLHPCQRRSPGTDLSSQHRACRVPLPKNTLRMAPS